MKKKVTNYTIVSAGDPSSFVHLIEGHLKEGWELYGRPWETDMSFRQAMVIKGEEEDE